MAIVQSDGCRPSAAATYEVNRIVWRMKRRNAPRNTRNSARPSILGILGAHSGPPGDA